ncbi:MAG: Mrp/NBP35 family ATP-binding protein [Ignavibacteriaceae bacterium]|nr:Mrp/NBP35 family ATP-binding protein [Ignavibacteriaceae bacterium]
MIDITKSDILAALKKIDEPNFNKDVLILNTIKKYELSDHKLNLFLSLPILEREIPTQLKTKFEEQLKKEYPALKEVSLKVEGRTEHSASEVNNSVLPGVKNTIAIASGKGGVGKSTVAVNLAVALAKDGAEVGLIDADIYGPSIPLMMGISGKPKVFQDANSMKMIPLESYGIKIMSIGLLVDDSSPIIWRGPMASGAVKQFMSDVEWGNLDYLIFDLPPGTGDIQLTLVQTIPLSSAVIVTTPQEVSLIDARKALKMFNRVNVPVAGIVENMSYFIAPDTKKHYDIFGSGGGSKLASELGVPFLGGIPIDPRIRMGGDNGVPIIFDMPNDEHAKIIMELSRSLDKNVKEIRGKNSSKVEIILDDN